MENKTPVVDLLALVHQHTNEAKGRSWQRLNGALQTCLDMAITSQFKFAPEDFAEISKNFSFGYWCGNDGFMSGERYYSQAVQCKNRSAAISFEKWKERKPFMLNGERLALHSRFLYGLEPVHAKTARNDLMKLRVTSIGAENIIACWYEPERLYQDSRSARIHDSPARRFTFTHAEIKAAQKEGRMALDWECAIKWFADQAIPGGE